MCYLRYCFNIFFAAAIEVVFLRFSKDATTLKDMIYLEEEAGVTAGTPVERVRRAVWEMMYADGAGVVSRSDEGLTRMRVSMIAPPPCQQRFQNRFRTFSSTLFLLLLARPVHVNRSRVFRFQFGLVQL